MCSKCDEEDNVNPILIAEGAVERAKRVDGFVRNGIAFLNTLVSEGVIEPGWADRIDILALDMKSVNNCVLGQIFAPLALAEYERDRVGNVYACLLSGYDYAQEVIDEYGEYGIDLGFNTGNAEWDELKAAWIFHIRSM